MAAQMFSCIAATPARSWSLKTHEICSSKVVALPTAWRIRPAAAPLARRADSLIVTATASEGDEKKDAAGSSSSTSLTESAEPDSSRTSSGSKASISERRAKAEAEVKKGQTTAIVTGAVAVLLGVAYLVLIQILDTRGVILVPPPPEAFDP